MRGFAILAVATFATACATAHVDQSSVRATAQAPEPVRVDPLYVAYDPALPYYVVTVEPLAFDAGGGGGGMPPVPGRYYGWGPWGWGLLPEGPQAVPYTPPPQGAHGQLGTAIARQLESALGNAGNIRIIDYDFFLEHRAKPSALVNRRANEVGPFVIRGSVTEFNEIAQATGSSSGGAGGAIGVALGIAGAIAGNTPAAATGAGLAVANPTYEHTVARRTGSVAMDLKIVDPTNGRIVGTVVANGSFTNESASNGFSLFGFGKASNAYAESALGQADRAAMNSATQQISDRLARVR